VGPASNQGAPFVTSEPTAGVSRDVIEIARQLVARAGGPARDGRPELAAAR
jgi:hypothetical protein